MTLVLMYWDIHCWNPELPWKATSLWWPRPSPMERPWLTSPAQVAPMARNAGQRDLQMTQAPATVPSIPPRYIYLQSGTSLFHRPLCKFITCRICEHNEIATMRYGSPLSPAGVTRTHQYSVHSEKHTDLYIMSVSATHLLPKLNLPLLCPLSFLSTNQVRCL